MRYDEDQKRFVYGSEISRQGRSKYECVRCGKKTTWWGKLKHTYLDWSWKKGEGGRCK